MRWLAAVVLLVGTTAHADGEPEPLSVAAKLAGVMVRLSATFRLDVVEGPGQNVMSIQLPAGGVVTKASVVVDGQRHPLRLDKATEAGTRFHAIADAERGAGERRWAIKIDGSSSSITFDALAPHAASMIVELGVDVPTCFYRDRRYALVPESWHARMTTRVDEPPAALEDLCAPAGTDAMKWVSLASPRPTGVGVFSGRLPLGSAHLARVELDLPRALDAVPKDLHTAIVIDHSRSLSAAELDAERAVIAAYVQEAPTSRVQVIAFARTAEALLPTWMIASQAAGRIDRSIRALASRNGSNVDVALAEAASWLSRAHGTKRLLLFTDEKLAARFVDPAAALASLVPAGTLVHVVVPSGSGGVPQRFDDGVLAELAKRTTGIEVTAGAEDIDPTILLRPISLDHLTIKGAGWELLDVFGERRCDGSERLLEAESCRWWGRGGAAAGPIAIDGLVWNRPFHRLVVPDPNQARTLARIITTADTLERELLAQAEQVAQAVNATWSLFGAWGGSGGYRDFGGFGSIGIGHISTGGSHDTGIGSFVGGAQRTIDLHDQLAAAVAHCDPAGVTASVELTEQEIVDVSVSGRDAGTQRCVSDAIWDATVLVAAAPARSTVRYTF